MANNFFQFKHFKVFQDQCAMKVGTDGVVLGLLARYDNCQSILDIGTGTGLVALMLAQQYPNARMDAVEIDPQAAHQAQQNANASPWKIKVHTGSIQDYSGLQTGVIHSDLLSTGYQLIVSNPPYFQNSLKTPLKNRNLARHTDSLSFEDLILSVYSLLAADGKFWVILPFEEGDNFWNFAKHHGLYLSNRINILPNKGKQPIRVVMGFVKRPCIPQQTELCIEDGGRHEYSEAFKALAQDYYLHL